MGIYGNYFSLDNFDIDKNYEYFIKETSNYLLLVNSLKMINEDSSIILEINIKEKISEIWKKMINFIKSILDKIKYLIKYRKYQSTEAMIDAASPKKEVEDEGVLKYNMQIFNIQIFKSKYSVDIDEKLADNMKKISDPVLKISEKAIKYMLMTTADESIFGKAYRSDFEHDLNNKLRDATKDVEDRKKEIKEYMEELRNNYEDSNAEIESINKSLSEYSITEKEVTLDINKFLSNSKNYIKSFSKFATDNKNLEVDFRNYLNKIESQEGKLKHQLDKYDMELFYEYPTIISEYVKLATNIYRAVVKYAALSIKIFDAGDFAIRRTLKKNFNIA